MTTEIIKPLTPGIYFNLDEDAYHADPSLGSTDTRRIAKNPADYWFGSWMNPNRKPDTDTPAKRRGTAVHVLVLYGETEFDKRYMRGPDFEDGMAPSDKGALTKAANVAAAKARKIMLPAIDYDNIAIASAMIAKNPKLARSLLGGMNEVSVFWVDPTTKVPHKARLDCLKPRGVGDLKSIANIYEKTFKQACRERITNYRYDVQAKLYLNGRALIPQFVADGAVHGDHDADMLKAIAKEKTYAWQFVFWQAEGAPITHSFVISPKNPILDIAAAVIAKGDANYNEYVERFGFSQMWLPTEEPEELFLEDMPPWFGRD